MQKFIVPLLLLKSIFYLGQGVDFTIAGKFPNNVTSKILYINGDSIKLTANKTFQYRGNLDKPSLVVFRAKDTYNSSIWCNGNILKIALTAYAKPGQCNTAKKYLKIQSVHGSSETASYQKLAEVNEQIASQHSSRDLLGVDSLIIQLYPYVKEFVQKKPKSYLSASLPGMYSFTKDEKKELFALIQDDPDKAALDILKTQIERDELTKRGTPVSDFIQLTIQNFFEGIKKGTKVNSEFAGGHQSTLLMQLGNISLRSGRTLNIDPKNGHIINDDEAMKYWSRQYQPGWEPKV